MPNSLVSTAGGLLVVGGGLAAADDPCNCCKPPVLGACCFLDDITGALACTEGVTEHWCSERTQHQFHAGKTCSEIHCQSIADGWWVDCYSICSDESSLCDGCGAGPFVTDAEANAWMNANPPPYCCEHTLVYVSGGAARRNPLP